LLKTEHYLLETKQRA